MKAKIDENTNKYIEKIKQAGGRVYIVGGFVRDNLLGIPSKDLDFEVYNLNFEQLQKIFGNAAKVQGNFGVFQLLNSDSEFAIPRLENKIGKKHQDFVINMDPFLSLEAATIRRDFTINSLMYDVQTGELIDLHRGIDDLKSQTLRHTSTKFNEDALRVLRAVRFSFKLGFKVAPETIGLCLTMLNELKYVTTARKNQEFTKIWKANNYQTGLITLEQVMLPYWNLSELTTTMQPANQHPEGSVWEHTKQGLLILKSQENKLDETDFLILCYAFLFHDIGKIKTQQLQADNKITFYGHESVSIQLATEIVADLIINKKHKKLILDLINDHMLVQQIDELKPKTLITLYNKYHDNFKLLLFMKIVDQCARMVEYNQEYVNNQIEKLIKNFYQPNWQLYQSYLELRQTYNGNYFIKQGFIGMEIKIEQEVILIRELTKIRKKSQT